jgi:hypothetical protein
MTGLACLAGAATGLALCFALLLWQQMRKSRRLRTRLDEFEQGHRIAVIYDDGVLTTAHMDGPIKATLPPGLERATR